MDLVPKDPQDKSVSLIDHVEILKRLPEHTKMLIEASRAFAGDPMGEARMASVLAAFCFARSLEDGLDDEETNKRLALALKAVKDSGTLKRDILALGDKLDGHLGMRDTEGVIKVVTPSDEDIERRRKLVRESRG